MLTLTIPESEMYNQANGKFITLPKVVLHLEHSLVSLSKWEQKYEKPFLGSEMKTTEETIDYVRFMCSDEEVPDEVLHRLTKENNQEISNYVAAKKTATTFNERNSRPNREIITSEIIYYWLVSLQIPFQPCESWHLNTLLALIKTVSLKSAPPKKMGKNDAAAYQRSLNAQRKAALGQQG